MSLQQKEITSPVISVRTSHEIAPPSADVVELLLPDDELLPATIGPRALLVPYLDLPIKMHYGH